jgi:general secretion pathway protein D
MSLLTFAADTMISFYFNGEELSKVIEVYSKAANQKFVVDSNVRGKATILNPEKVSTEEAFNQLSTALAMNSYAISKQGDTMIILPARNIQRNLIETTTTVPNLKPERIVTWIYTMKNVPAEQINRDLRILLSRDGEMSVLTSKNQLIITDWTSSLQRVNNLFAEIDKPNTAAVAKIVDKSQKERLAKKAAAEKEKKKEEESTEAKKDTKTE